MQLKRLLMRKLLFIHLFIFLIVILQKDENEHGKRIERSFKMWKKYGTILFFLMMISILVGGKTVNAMEESILKINPDANVMVLYSTEDWEVDENIRLLDLKIGHFSDTIQYKNVHELETDDLNDKTHLFYYGHVKEKLLPIISELISQFKGPTILPSSF